MPWANLAGFAAPILFDLPHKFFGLSISRDNTLSSTPCWCSTLWGCSLGWYHSNWHNSTLPVILGAEDYPSIWRGLVSLKPDCSLRSRMTRARPLSERTGEKAADVENHRVDGRRRAHDRPDAASGRGGLPHLPRLS